MSVQQYIENCIWRILKAPCHVSRETERVRDIAGAIRVAVSSEQKESAAHGYLSDLCTKAEAGAYKRPKIG